MKYTLIGLAGAALLLGGCSTTSPGSMPNGRANPWTIPHVLRYANAQDISTLNPLLAQTVGLRYLSSLTGAFLVKWDKDKLPYAELAAAVPTKANGGVSADGLTITYHLRRDLKWSDGQPLTADDVAWTYGAIVNPANDVATTSGWDLINKIDEPDKATIVFHLRKLYSPFVETFFSSAGASPSILPKHLLAKYPNVTNAPFNELPIGAGPFRYEKWVRSQKVVMIPNPYYFRGPPKLKEIVFEIIPSRDTIFTQLASHELDMWTHVGGAYLARIAELPGYTALHQVTYEWEHIDFNVTHPGVSDPVVRHALELATDRATIIKKFARGFGVLQESIAPKGSPYDDPSIPLEPFDLAKANELLDRDGWKRGADGIREKGGVRLDLTFVALAGSQNAENQIEFIRSTWVKIGVAMNLRNYAAPQLFAPYADGGILLGGKFDAIMFITGDDPIGDFSALLGCDQIPPAGQNDMRWCNRKVDTAVHALYAHYDQAQRNADDRIVFQELAKDRPQITIFGVEEGYIYNKDLKGFNPNALTPFDSMQNVDI